MKYFAYIVVFCELIVLLSGCGAPKPIGKQLVTDDGGNVSNSVGLSKEHIAGIRKAFIGKTVIFKEDWYEYAVIDSDPLGGFGTPTPITTFRPWMENNTYRVRAFGKGNVAKITGCRMYRDGITFIATAENGAQAFITIINYRPWTLPFGSRNSDRLVQRRALDDELNTVAWIERNLTYHTFDFVENLPKIPEIKLDLPKPPQDLQLTPVPMETHSASTAAAISQLAIKVDPPRVRNNQELNLILDFHVDAAGRPSAMVTEIRTLLFEDEVLPGYPKKNEESRAGGQYSTSFKLTIPPRAGAGTYTFKGEVCIEGDCLGRSRQFQVEP